MKGAFRAHCAGSMPPRISLRAPRHWAHNRHGTRFPDLRAGRVAAGIFSITNGGGAVPLLHAGHSRAAVSLPADPTPVPSQPSLPAGNLGRPSSVSVQPPAELEALIEPMLAAIVRLADADAGTVRVIAADGACYEPVVAVGIPGAENGARADARSTWCNACSESRDAQSECVRNEDLRPRRNSRGFPGDCLQAYRLGAAAPQGHSGRRAESDVRSRASDGGCDDSAAAGDRRPPRHDARQRAPRAQTCEYA